MHAGNKNSSLTGEEYEICEDVVPELIADHSTSSCNPAKVPRIQR